MRGNCINKSQPNARLFFKNEHFYAACRDKYFYKQPLVRQNLLQLADPRKCYTMLQVIDANN